MTVALSIRGKNGKYSYYQVDDEVYDYVKQLEKGIRLPEVREELRKNNPVRFRK